MNYLLLSKKELPKSLVELEIEIPADDISAFRSRTLKRLVSETQLPGFRKGNVPEKMVRDSVGELALWERASEEALPAALLEIFKTEKIDAVGHPGITITMLAPGNPLRAKITIARIPLLALPDYKKIAALANEKSFPAPAVDEKEIDAIVAEIQKIRAEKKKPDSAESNGAAETTPLSDEDVRQIGNFKTVADFRAAVAEDLKLRKKEEEREKRRAALLNAIASEIKEELPDILIESELARMEAELRDNIERFGATIEKYLAETKKTLEELRFAMRPDAKQRALLHLALFEIARAENIKAPAETIEAETKKILEQNKGADAKAAAIFVETFLTNQKVIEFLEQL